MAAKTLLLLLAVSVIAFALVSLSPVDPVQQYVLGAGGVSAEQRQQLEEYWGVNAPPVERYITWLKALVRGGFRAVLSYTAALFWTSLGSGLSILWR